MHEQRGETYNHDRQEYMHICTHAYNQSNWIFLPVTKEGIASSSYYYLGREGIASSSSYYSLSRRMNEFLSSICLLSSLLCVSSWVIDFKHATINKHANLLTFFFLFSTFFFCFWGAKLESIFNADFGPLLLFHAHFVGGPSLFLFIWMQNIYIYLLFPKWKRQNIL